MGDFNNSEFLSPECLKLFDSICSRYPILSKEEEIELCKKYEHNLPERNRLLILHNISFAFSLCKKFHEKSETRDDFFQRVLAGYGVAAERFDISKGYRFNTFAAPYARLFITNDLFNQTLTKCQVQSASNLIFDKPVDDEDNGTTTIGELFSTNNGVVARDSSWKPIDPSFGQLDEIEKKNDEEFVTYICNVVLANCNNTVRDIFRLKLRGNTITDIAKKLGISRGVARRAFILGLATIKKKTKVQDTRYNDLRTLLSGYNKKSDDSNSVHSIEDINTLANEHHIQLVASRESISDEQFYELKMNIFDGAIEYTHKIFGETGYGVDFAFTRKVYEVCIARKHNIIEASKILNIPATYVEFLRDRAVRMVIGYNDFLKDPQKRIREFQKEIIKNEKDKLDYEKKKRFIRENPFGFGISHEDFNKPQKNTLRIKRQNELEHITKCSTTNWEHFIGVMKRKRCARYTIRYARPLYGNFYAEMTFAHLRKKPIKMTAAEFKKRYIDV